MEETKKQAEKFISYVSVHAGKNVFGLSGDLGAGKTLFTKCVAELLGIDAHVTSPTFVIQKRYPIRREGFPYKTLIHIDAYRLESAHELEVLDWKELSSDPSNLILIEWPEKVAEALPQDAPIIRFSFVSEHVRSIEFPAMMA